MPRISCAAALVLLRVLVLPTTAHGQGYFAPFGGADFGGDAAGCTVTATWAFVKDMQVQHNRQLNSAAQNLTQRQCQIVYGTNSGDGNFRFDFGPFATMPYSAAQTGAVTVNPNAAESVGQRSTLINAEATASATNAG